MSRKTKVIGVRVDEEVNRRLLQFESETGIERVTLARNAMIAALKFYEKNRRISFPLKVVEASGFSQRPLLDEEEMARLRPEDKGTPVLEMKSQTTTADTHA